MIRRVAHPVNEQLPPIERAQIPGRRIAKTDDAKQPIVHGIDNGNRVRELLRGVDTVTVTHWCDCRWVPSRLLLGAQLAERYKHGHERHSDGTQEAWSRFHFMSPSGES